MIFEKYILLRLLGPMLIITLGITSIAWLSQSLRFVDFIVNKGLGIGTFFYITTLIIPSLLWVVVPISLFISVIYSFNKMAFESELIIFKSSGIDNKTIIKPVLVFSVICTIISFLIATYFLPVSYRKFKDTQNIIRNNYASLLLQEGVFSSPIKDVTVFVKERDYQGIFHEILVNDERTNDKKITVLAQEGRLVNTEKGPVFEFINGTHQELNLKNNQVSMLYFDKYNLQLDPLKDKIESSRWREPTERFLSELFFPKDANDKALKELAAEGHYRLTWPLYNFLLALIAVAPFLFGEFSRRGYAKKMITYSVISVVFVVASLILKNLAPKIMYINWLMYVVVLLGIWIFYYKLTKPAKSS